MRESEIVAKYLINNNITISFMESCTSGLLASMLTDNEGASGIFKGSLVTYSNEMKIAAGVDKAIIEEYGVYSKECARSMAEVVRKTYETDISIGITGTTGNVDVNNKDSSQGEVFFCIFYNEKAYDYHMKHDVDKLLRNEIKQLYANEVYKELIKVIGE